MSEASRGGVPWRPLFWAAIAAQVCALYWPWTVPPPPGDIVAWDKIVHVGLFGAVAFTGVAAGIRPWILIILLMVHAPLSEWIQGTFLPRYADVGDVIADVSGTLLGVGLGIWWTRRRGCDGDVRVVPGPPSKAG